MKYPIITLNKKKLKLREEKGKMPSYEPTILNQGQTKKVQEILNKYKNEVEKEKFEPEKKRKTDPVSYRFTPLPNKKWHVLNGKDGETQQIMEVVSFEWDYRKKNEPLLVVNWAPPAASRSEKERSVTHEKTPDNNPMLVEEMKQSDEASPDHRAEMEVEDVDFENFDRKDLITLIRNLEKKLASNGQPQPAQEQEDYHGSDVQIDTAEKYYFFEKDDLVIEVPYEEESDMDDIAVVLRNLENCSKAPEEEHPAEMMKLVADKNQEERASGAVDTNGSEIVDVEQANEHTESQTDGSDDGAETDGASAIWEASSSTMVDNMGTRGNWRTKIPSDAQPAGSSVPSDDDEQSAAENARTRTGRLRSLGNRSPLNAFCLLHEEGMNSWITDDIMHAHLWTTITNEGYVCIDSSELGDCSVERKNDARTRSELEGYILKKSSEGTVIMPFTIGNHWRLALINRDTMECYDPMAPGTIFDNIEMMKYLAHDLRVEMKPMHHDGPRQNDSHNCGIFVLLKVEEVCHNRRWDLNDVKAFRKRLIEKFDKSENFYWTNFDFEEQEHPMPEELKNVLDDAYEVPIDVNPEESHDNAENDRHSASGGHGSVAEHEMNKKRPRTEDDSEELPSRPPKLLKKSVVNDEMRLFEQGAEEDMATRGSMPDATLKALVNDFRSLDRDQLVSKFVLLARDNNWLEQALKIREKESSKLKMNQEKLMKKFVRLMKRNEKAEKRKGDERNRVSSEDQNLDTEAKEKYMEFKAKMQAELEELNTLANDFGYNVYDLNTTVDAFKKEVAAVTEIFVDDDRERLINKILQLKDQKHMFKNIYDIGKQCFHFKDDIVQEKDEVIAGLEKEREQLEDDVKGWRTMAMYYKRAFKNK